MLIGSSVTDHPQFLDICDFLIDLRMPFSIPSIRIDSVSLPIISRLKKSGMKTITFAPETGSDRLRRKVGKSISNHAIFEGSAKLLNSGFSALKMYFLLPPLIKTRERDPTKMSDVQTNNSPNLKMVRFNNNNMVQQ